MRTWLINAGFLRRLEHPRSSHRYGQLMEVNPEWSGPPSPPHDPPQSRPPHEAGEPPKSPHQPEHLSAKPPQLSYKEDKKRTSSSTEDQNSLRRRAGASRSRGLSKPALQHLVIEDLRDDLRLWELYCQAVHRGDVRNCEAKLIWFFAQAVHALRCGKRNPCGMFVACIRKQIDHVSEEDEDVARKRLESLRRRCNGAGYVRAVPTSGGSGSETTAAPDQTPRRPQRQGRGTPGSPLGDPPEIEASKLGQVLQDLPGLASGQEEEGANGDC